MKKFLKWTGFVVTGLFGIASLGTAWIFFASERALHRHHEVAAAPAIAIPTEPVEIEEGRRLAHLTGCTHCHAENLSGAVPLDIPGVVRFVAPNVTAMLPSYSDAQLITLLRKGVKRDGTGVFFMPAEMFQHLNDQDLGRIIAWLRTMPRVDGVKGQTEVRFIGRAILAKGDFRSGPGEIEAHPSPLARDARSSAPGAYFAMSLCSECHGQDLNGRAEAHAPSLHVMARAYSPEAFARLLHDGVAQGGRKLELMSPTARARFAMLDPGEARQILDYLKSSAAVASN